MKYTLPQALIRLAIGGLAAVGAIDVAFGLPQYRKNWREKIEQENKELLEKGTPEERER